MAAQSVTLRSGQPDAWHCDMLRSYGDCAQFEHKHPVCCTQNHICDHEQLSCWQDAVCMMALMAGARSLRLYSLEGLREGARKPVRKQLLEYAIIHAGALATPQGPGLAVITSEGFVAVGLGNAV